MNLQYLCFFALIILFHGIIHANCKSRTTMEEDIAHTDYTKIHKYEPHNSFVARQQMHFHKDFPISKFIVAPLRRLLNDLEDNAVRKMESRLHQAMLSKRQNHLKILKDKILHAIPSNDKLKKFFAPKKGTNSTKFEKRVLTLLPVNDDHQELNVIKETFRKVVEQENMLKRKTGRTG